MKRKRAVVKKTSRLAVEGFLEQRLRDPRDGPM
jgi:hypothetical protein